MPNEIKSAAKAFVQKIENVGTFEWDNKEHQKYCATVSVPGHDDDLEMDVVVWNKPGAPCPLQEGEVSDLRYKEVVLKDGDVKYSWVSPDYKGKSGGGKSDGGWSPKVGLEASKTIGGKTIKASWLGFESEVKSGIKKINAALKEMELAEAKPELNFGDDESPF